MPWFSEPLLRLTYNQAYTDIPFPQLSFNCKTTSRKFIRTFIRFITTFPNYTITSSKFARTYPNLITICIMIVIATPNHTMTSSKFIASSPQAYTNHTPPYGNRYEVSCNKIRGRSHKLKRCYCNFHQESPSIRRCSYKLKGILCKLNGA